MKELRWANWYDPRAQAILKSPRPETPTQSLAFDLWKKLDGQRPISPAGTPLRISYGPLEFLLRAHRIDEDRWAKLEILISAVEDEFWNIERERANAADAQKAAKAPKSVTDIVAARKR